MEAVEVLWMDSCSSNMNWTIAEDIEVEPIYIDSFGIVVKDTDEFLAIAQNYGNDPEQYSNIITIPKGCIKKVIVIPENDKCENEQKPIEPNWVHHKVDLSDCSEEYTKGYYDGWNNCNQQHSQYKAEQKPAEWSEEDSYMLGQAIRCVNNSGKLDVSTGEIEDWLTNLRPEQEWSKEDEDYYDAIITKLEITQDDASLTDNQMKFLKSLKNKIQPQPKQEWSEEDERMQNNLIRLLVRLSANTRTDSTSPNYTYPLEINWLKSLHPQSH